jgi:hypothetical protein
VRGRARRGRRRILSRLEDIDVLDRRRYPFQIRGSDAAVRAVRPDSESNDWRRWISKSEEVCVPDPSRAGETKFIACRSECDEAGSGDSLLVDDAGRSAPGWWVEAERHVGGEAFWSVSCETRGRGRGSRGPRCGFGVGGPQDATDVLHHSAFEGEEQRVEARGVEAKASLQNDFGNCSTLAKRSTRSRTATVRAAVTYEEQLRSLVA